MAQKRKSKKQIKQKQKQQQRQSVIVKIDQSKKITRRTPTQSDKRPILPQSLPPQMITIPQYIPQFIPQINPISGEKSIKAEPTELMTSKTAKPQFIGTETPNLQSIQRRFDLGDRTDAFSELSSNLYIPNYLGENDNFSELSSNLHIPEYIGKEEEIPTTNNVETTTTNAKPKQKKNSPEKRKARENINSKSFNTLPDDEKKFLRDVDEFDMRTAENNILNRQRRIEIKNKFYPPGETRKSKNSEINKKLGKQ